MYSRELVNALLPKSVGLSGILGAAPEAVATALPPTSTAVGLDGLGSLEEDAVALVTAGSAHFGFAGAEDIFSGNSLAKRFSIYSSPDRTA
jgi:hypothetical protein